MAYFDSVRLDVPYAEAVRKVRAALGEQGFGVLTEIDVRATLKAKLGAEMEDYVILGACNPPLAHRALDMDRTVGLLLPCNVVVRAVAGGSVVEVLDPRVIATVADRADLGPVAEEARSRLSVALAALR